MEVVSLLPFFSGLVAGFGCLFTAMYQFACGNNVRGFAWSAATPVALCGVPVLVYAAMGEVAALV